MAKLFSFSFYKSFYNLVAEALRGGERDFTKGSLRKAVFLLAIPMILEMCMESVFAVVDIYFVGKLGKDAAATVGLTESFLTIVYSVAIGLSMAATAMVSRRVGEKNREGASRAGMQAIFLAMVVTLVISVAGAIFTREILQVVGAPPSVLEMGVPYARLMFGGCIVIILLFLINGIFRGAGDASIAMKSLWIANAANIILCPIFIFGVGPVPAFGLLGAAMATTTGRGIGVCYQLYCLTQSKGIISFRFNYLAPDKAILSGLLKIASTGTMQFIIASASWIFLARIIAGFGSSAVAGYTISIRLLLFFLLPAWGLANAAATLVGQNLGAQQPSRAEKSVWTIARYNTVFMVFVTAFFYFFGSTLVRLINHQPDVVEVATQALHIITLGYVAYGIGMVLMNAFNGAGDSRTPTFINLVGFWLFQIPLAYTLALKLSWGPKGVFIAVLIAETAITIGTYFLFKRGKWKKIMV